MNDQGGSDGDGNSISPEFVVSTYNAKAKFKGGEEELDKSERELAAVEVKSKEIKKNTAEKLVELSFARDAYPAVTEVSTLMS